MRARSFIAVLPFIACAHPAPPAPAPGPDDTARVETPPTVPSVLDAGIESPPASSAPSFELVVDSALPELALATFDRFAVIATRSLFLMVDGDRVTQDPRFLQGLPEWINWDASVYLDIPRAAKIENGLPLGTERAGHAGNRHGPDFGQWWTKTGWSTHAPKADARLSKLPKPATLYSDSIQLALPSGELVVVRYDAEIEAFVLPAHGGTPTRSVVSSAAGIRHSLLGEKADDLYLCETSQGLFHFDGKDWSPVATERTPVSCARTSDGVLWLVLDARGSEPEVLVSQQASGWKEQPLPEGVRPQLVATAGNRVWVTAERKQSRYLVYSNQRVTEVASVDESELPGPLWVNGITGLDVTSVDVVSVSTTPAGPGTSACTSPVVWLGPKLTPELEKALGTPRPRVVETAGIVPGTIAPSANGSSMMIVAPSGKTRKSVAAIPKSYGEGVELVKRVRAALPTLGARLLCAAPRVVRDL